MISMGGILSRMRESSSGILILVLSHTTSERVFGGGDGCFQRIVSAEGRFFTGYLFDIVFQDL
jgi:hypothetical protein